MKIRERISRYKTARSREAAENRKFRKVQHRIHLLMNLFLAIIIGEWLAVLLSEGFHWEGVWEILIAVGVHLVVESLALHGYAALGGAVVLADEALNVAGVLRLLLRAGLLLRWQGWLSVSCSFLLAGIGAYLIFSPEVYGYARRAREILGVLRGSGDGA